MFACMNNAISIVTYEISFKATGGYISDKSTLHTFTLPSDFESGDRVWFAFYDDKYVKAVQVEILIEPSGISMRGIAAKYTTKSKGLDYDFDTGGSSSKLATTTTAAGYGITYVSVNGSSPYTGVLQTSYTQIT